jgi:hypothetical protein
MGISEYYQMFACICWDDYMTFHFVKIVLYMNTQVFIYTHVCVILFIHLNKLYFWDNPVQLLDGG